MFKPYSASTFSNQLDGIIKARNTLQQTRPVSVFVEHDAVHKDVLQANKTNYWRGKSTHNYAGYKW